ncbi:PrsW family intramembrane metalloprotease [Dermacoccaceae bacterium W4C1]
MTQHGEQAITHATSGSLTYRRRQRVPSAILVLVMSMIFGIGGSVMLLLIGDRAGVAGMAFGFVLSALVVGIIVPVFVWLDRYESEPRSMMIFAFGWGACIATLGSVVLNDVGGFVLGNIARADNAVTLIVAPVVEESLKGLGLVLLLMFRRREIDGILDGMVYAGLIGCGFAFVEDILYLADGYATAGDDGLLGTFAVRVLMSPFAHPMFTVCIGIGIGYLAVRRVGWSRWLAPVLGWVVAVALHSAWNGAALLSMDGWLALYLAVQLPLFFAFFALLWWARRREGRTIAEQLRPYVEEGRLSAAEAAMLASVPERRFARQWAERHGGQQSRERMQEFQTAASELALLRAKIRRSGQGEVHVGREGHLLEVIADRRTEFQGSAIYRRYEVLGHL